MLRSYEVLDEVREAQFFLDGKDFIHFHDEPDGLWADVRLSQGRLRKSVATLAEQAELMGQIAAKLDVRTAPRRRARMERRRRGSSED